MDPTSLRLMQGASGSGTKARPTVVGTNEQEITSNVTTLTFNIPAGTQNGDLMVALVAGGGGNNNVGDWANANWTWAAERTSSPNLAVAYRIASSEGSTVSFTTTNSCKLGGILRVFRGAAWGTAGTVNTGSGTSLTATGITVPDNNSILLGHFAIQTGNVTWTNGSDLTKIAELDSDSFSHSWYIATKDVDAGATGNKALTSSGNADWEALLVSISPS